MRIEVHTDPQAFADLGAEWQDLLPRSFSDTLFQQPAWQEAWWRVFGVEGMLRLIAVRDGSGRLAGVAPLFLGQVAANAAEPLPTLSFERPISQPGATVHSALLFVGGTEVSDYLDMVVDRTQGPAVYQALWETVLEAIPGWEWIDLHCLPDGSPTLTMLGNLAKAKGFTVTVGQEDVCPFIALPDSWEAYLSRLGRKERHELRRKMRRAELSGQVELTTVSDEAGLESSLATFIALHEASTPDKADFMRDPRMREFFRLVAHAALANGWLDLSFLAVDGEPAASMFCFRYHDAVLVYNSGFDPRAWAGLSPGIVLLGLRIQQAIEEGRREFDFLQGNERYKYDLGAQDRPVWRLFIRRPA